LRRGEEEGRTLLSHANGPKADRGGSDRGKGSLISEVSHEKKNPKKKSRPMCPEK